jgi:membrane protein implicated in regulation of membrane protease activity
MGPALEVVLTLPYGLVLTLQAEGDIFRFLMVSVVLLVVFRRRLLKVETRIDLAELQPVRRRLP